MVLVNNIRGISDELRKRLVSILNKKKSKRKSDAELYNKYLKIKFKEWHNKNSCPKTQKQINKLSGTYPQLFDQKYLPNLFRIGLVFIFEKRPKGIELLKKFDIKWKKGVKYYYMLIPETSRLVISINRIIKDFDDYVDFERVLPMIRTLTNNMALYEVLSKAEETKTESVDDRKRIVFSDKNKKRIGLKIVFSDKNKKRIELKNDIFGNLGMIESEDGKKLLNTIVSSFGRIILHIQKSLTFEKMLEKNLMSI